MFLKLALRNIFRNRSRSMITLLAIASGCIAVILAGGFIQHSITSLREAYIRDFIGHIRIYAPGFLKNGMVHPFDYMISDPKPLIEKMDGLEHVRYVAPRLGFAGLLSNGDSAISLFVEGVDPSIEMATRNAVHLEAGRYFEGQHPYQILIGKGLAKAMDFKIGDAVVLVANTKRGSINAADLSVQGIFGTSDKNFDDHTARIPIGIAQTLLRVDEVQTLIVFLDSTANTAKVKTALEDMFRAQGLPYEVKAWYELDEADFIVKATAFYQRLFLVLKLIILLVVSLSIINTMNMSVLERIGEVGTMQALGTRRRGILDLLLLEGLIMGILGGALGCVGGMVLAEIISFFGIPMPSPPGSTIQWVARITVVPSVVGFAFAMSVVIALLSSGFPALKASHLDIGDALRHNL